MASTSTVPGSDAAHTVVAGLARGLIELAVSKGAHRDALAQRSQIDPNDLDDPDFRVPLFNYVALMRAGKELTNDPALALHYGETVELSGFSVVGLIVQACETVLEAHNQMNRYGRLVMEVDVGSGDRFEYRRIDGKLWVVDTRRNPNDFPELTEGTFAHMVSLVGKFGPTPPAKEVRVTHRAPAHRPEYDRIFQAPVVFESEFNGIQIDDAWLDFPISLQPRFAFGILSEHAESMLGRLEGSKTFRGRVESLLMPILHTGDAGIDRIAAQLRISRGTIYRKLKAEGLTFEQVLEELRHQLALHYLRGRKATVNEIAYLVGFSDSTSFSRAFRRWTGTSPRTMRGRSGSPEKHG